jgi:aerobic-type carbon monoxide dehydrogenase small subunit (CoxS/CutS family)
MRSEVTLSVNGKSRIVEVEPRTLLVDLLREHLGLTGTHVGCDHGVCGVCSVLVDGKVVRSCLTLAVQADATEIVTVEGIGSAKDPHPLQTAFSDHHALQCGYCTPGFLITAYQLLSADDVPTDDEIREALSGVLCRCTGYANILRAVQAVRDARLSLERDASPARAAVAAAGALDPSSPGSVR